MKYSKWEKQFAATIAVAVIALVWFYMVCKFFFANNMLISINNIAWDNIFIKLADDYLAMLISRRKTC